MGGHPSSTKNTAVVRAFTVLSGAALFAGAVLTFQWLRPVDTFVASGPIEPARALEVPSTVAPLAPSVATVDHDASDASAPAVSLPPRAETTPARAIEPSVTVSTVAAAPPTTLLADLLPPIDRGAAVPDDLAPRATPISIETSVFDTTDYPVRGVGLEDDGQLEIPDETEIGWYRYGASPGLPGATVLAAHVSWNGSSGPFFELGRLDPGARISVTLDDGTSREYEVTERAKYEKDELPRERIWRNTGDESLVLITCGGDFNPEIRRYRHNIVVYAVPVG